MTGGQVDERKRLVVTQQHVVAGHQPLDHVAFEQQRLGFGVGDDDLDGSSLGHHASQPVRQPGGMRVVLDPTLQIACFADIEPIPPAVEHAIDARLRRHRPQRLSNDQGAGGDSLRRDDCCSGFGSRWRRCSLCRLWRAGDRPWRPAGIHWRRLLPSRRTP